MRPRVAMLGLVGLMLLVAAPAAPARGVSAPSVSELAGQGFEVKAVIRKALILQKGGSVYWCVLHLAKSSPLSYQSESYAVN